MKTKLLLPFKAMCGWISTAQNIEIPDVNFKKHKITTFIVFLMILCVGNAQEVLKTTHVYVFNQDVKDIEIIISSIQGEKSIILMSENDDFKSFLTQISTIKKDFLIESVNFFSHGKPGSFFIGNEKIDIETLSKPRQMGYLYALNIFLSQKGNFNVFACDTGKGIIGEKLYSKLSDLSKFKIAMSNNKTGANGDWILEVNNGEHLKGYLDVAFLEKKYRHSLQEIVSEYCVTEFSETPNPIHEFAYDPLNNDIYGVVGSFGESSLIRIDKNGNLINVSSPTNPWYESGTYFYPYISTDLAFAKDSVYFQVNGFILAASDLKSETISFKTSHSLSGENVSGYEAGMAVREGMIYTTDGNSSTNNIWKYDPTTGLSEVVVTGLPGGSSDGLEYCKSTDKMYFMSKEFGVYEIDIINNSTVQVVPFSALIGSQYANFSIDPLGKYAYVHHGNSIGKYNLLTGEGELIVQGFQGTSRQDLLFAKSSGDSMNYSLYFAGTSFLYELRAFEFLSPKLEEVVSECEVFIEAPVYRECGLEIVATTSTEFPISLHGTTVVTWTYNDGNGTIGTQTQNVLVKDIIAPVPNIETLADITAACDVTSLEAPTATDNCKGTITGVHTVSLPINGNGTTTEITWTFDDGNGNSTTQTQWVIIEDVAAPEPDKDLTDITGQYDVYLTAPTATDNCVGTVIGATTDPVHYDEIGTFITTWFFDDGYGNTSSQTQTVIIGESVESHGFSPNDDGINDTWTIDGIETYPKCKVQVYNRNGAKVYEKVGYKNTWDGYSNTGSHKKMMSGAYYYIIQFNKNGLKPTSGWLYINY
ncbi:MAG: gliding motility-associated C-terminal domain-containing protein [Flavobacteriaceae bacterium]|nr:gliding motility-associated C-terminal domain-containing protein [Flavobacteriaceae bacterium]